MSSIRQLLSLCLATSAITFACGPQNKSESPSTAATDVQPNGKNTQMSGSNFAKSSTSLLPTALANDPMGVTIHRLKNGLTVYISTDRSTPSISSWIAVRSGSRHDPADSTGLAHYLEHMLFKGSGSLGSLNFEKEKTHLDNIAAHYDELRLAKSADQRKSILEAIDRETLASAQYSVPNEFDNLYASLGIGGVNAFTSDDQTVYIATVPSNQFETWAKVEGDRFTNPEFRLFYPELETVYEEKNRSLDNPRSRISELVSKHMFPNHPYGTQPTLGHVEHLKSPAYGDMVTYFDSWYRPNNMAIVLSGDIDAETALPALEAAFSGLVPKSLPELPPSTLTPPTQRKTLKVVAPGEQSVLIAWPTVAAGHKDQIALDVMDFVIDNSATGLLNIELVLSQKLPSAGSYGYNQREAGVWIINGTARDGQDHAEVEALLLGVVEKLKSGAFSQSDLEAIIINREISEKRKLESNGARVSRMAGAFIDGRDWKDVVKDQERLRMVTREDVMRVANTYLTDAPIVVNRVRGEFAAEKVEKPQISPIKIDSSKESSYAKTIKALPVEPLSPQWLVAGEHYNRGELPAGPLVTVNNERNDLFTLEYNFKIGRQREPLLCYALSLLERSGAGQRTPEQLQKALYAMGSSIEFSCGTRNSYITLSGIDRKMEETIALLNEWIASPQVPGDALGKLLANEISQRKDAMNEPSVISSALTQYALAGKNSRFLRVSSNKVLSRAKQKQLLTLVSKLMKTKYRTSYFGPRTEGLAATIAIGSKHRRAKAAKPIRYSKIRKPTLFFVDQKVAQTQIRIGWPAPELKEPDVLRAYLFNQYVGGMGGLIFQEIREARGLAYSAWANHNSTAFPGDESLLIAGMGTQADKTVEAVSTLLGLLVPLRVENGRYKVAVKSIDSDFRKNRTSPRRRADTVWGWEDRGLSEDPEPGQFALLHKTSAAEMQSFANSRTKTAPVFAITGDSTRIVLKELAKALGVKDITIVKAQDLCGY